MGTPHLPFSTLVELYSKAPLPTRHGLLRAMVLCERLARALGPPVVDTPGSCRVLEQYVLRIDGHRNR